MKLATILSSLAIATLEVCTVTANPTPVQDAPSKVERAAEVVEFCCTKFESAKGERVQYVAWDNQGSNVAAPMASLTVLGCDITIGFGLTPPSKGGCAFMTPEYEADCDKSAKLTVQDDKVCKGH